MDNVKETGKVMRRSYTFAFNVEEEADVIEALDTSQNMTDLVRRAIRRLISQEKR